MVFSILHRYVGIIVMTKNIAFNILKMKNNKKEKRSAFNIKQN